MMMISNLTVVSILVVLAVALSARSIGFGETPNSLYSSKNYPSTFSGSNETEFSFGPLANLYEDAQYGFSLKYPNELRLMIIGGCPGLIEDKTGTKWGFWIGISNPECQMGMLNVHATSLDDYRHDYTVTSTELGHGETENIEYRTYVISSEDFITEAGSIGLKQIYRTLQFNPDTGEEIPGSDHTIPAAIRYVFHSPEKGFFTLLVRDNYPMASFSDLENAIMRSILF